jgi:hypothetical protein
LYLIVVGLAVREDFADGVDQSLYLVDVLGFLPLYYQCNTDDLGDGCDIQEESLSGLRRGQDWRLGDEHFEVVKCRLRLVCLAEGIRLF